MLQSTLPQSKAAFGFSQHARPLWRIAVLWALPDRVVEAFITPYWVCPLRDNTTTL